jgi:hypothetical protein
MNILGIGKIGSAIADQFSEYQQYEIYKVSSNVKTNDKCFYLPEYSDPEQYDNNPINPNFDIDSQLDVIISGEDIMSSAILRILENYQSCSIRVFYIKPSHKFLSEVQKLTDKVVYNVLQEYTRSKKLDSMFIIEYDSIVKMIGKVPITQVQKKIYNFVSSTLHMINFLDNNEPIMSNFQETPATYCINTIGIMDFSGAVENKLFLLDNAREKRYYYCINEKQLNTDGELFDKINSQIDSKIEENTSIMFGIYPIKYDENYCYVIYKSPHIQK